MPKIAHLFARPEVETCLDNCVRFFDPSFDGIRVIEPGTIRQTIGDRPAIDVVLGDPFADQVNRRIGQAIEFAGALRADAAEQGLQTAGEAMTDEAAVTTRSAPSNPPRLNQDHFASAFRKSECGRQSGHATADHADLRLGIAFKCRASVVIGEGTRVIAVDISSRCGGHRETPVRTR